MTYLDLMKEDERPENILFSGRDIDMSPTLDRYIADGRLDDMPTIARLWPARTHEEGYVRLVEHFRHRYEVPSEGSPPIRQAAFFEFLRKIDAYLTRNHWQHICVVGSGYLARDEHGILVRIPPGIRLRTDRRILDQKEPGGEEFSVGFAL